MSTTDLLKNARRTAMDMLARREHCRHELAVKLKKKITELTAEILTDVLDQLEQDNLLSDERFIESFIRAKAQKGYGPVWIKNTLQQKRLSESLITQYLYNSDYDWLEMVCYVRNKRFSELPGNDTKLKAKQFRFLQYRGFTAEQIAYAFRSIV